MLQSPLDKRNFQAGKLTDEQRKCDLEPLLKTGWTIVNNRDAIYKEFLFKNFNEVMFIYIFYFEIH